MTQHPLDVTKDKEIRRLKAGGEHNRNNKDEYQTRKDREMIQKLYRHNTKRMHRGDDAHQMDKHTERIQKQHRNKTKTYGYGHRKDTEGKQGARKKRRA